ncbi:tyrosyl-tRNA synthetase [Hysterangium stoloniferum]|nr:tyrosyl-tRNA synthetase [Hysterangium stoloniferum]
MSAGKERYDLITRRLQEVLGGEAIKNILSEGKTPKCYLGTAATGRPEQLSSSESVDPYCEYTSSQPISVILVPLTKIADFLRADVEAHVHAFLDNLKALLALVEHGTRYYEHVLRAVFTSLSIPVSKLRFVQGSTYQLSREYNMDNYKLCATVIGTRCQEGWCRGHEAGGEFGISSAGTLYQLYLPRLGYRKRPHLMNAMVPGPQGAKMSSSDPNSKIDFLDPPSVIRQKIKKAFCEEGDIAENGLLAFQITAGTASGREGQSDAKRPFAAADAPEGSVFSIPRDEKYGGLLHFSKYKDLEDAFAAAQIHPGDLKKAVGDAIVDLLEPIQEAFQTNEEWQKVTELAYPSEVKEVKKKREKICPATPREGKECSRATSS